MKTFIYILILVCGCLHSFATNGDTTKVKYDINDPRNPNCPCHQYQKIADEEYLKQTTNKQIQQATKYVGEKIVAVRNSDGDVGSIVADISKSNSGKAASNELKKVKVNRSVFAKRSVGQHKNHTPKKKRFRFGKKDNSRCTKW